MSKTTQANRTSTALDASDVQPADRVVTGAERRAAVATWLLTAARDRDVARREWRCDGVARLRCGGVFTAIRVPMPLVEAAAGTAERRRIGAYLSEALLGGAAFIDETSSAAYFLVPPMHSTLWGRVPDTRCLTPDIELCVPNPDPDPDMPSRWLLEMGGPGDLCVPEAVKQLVYYARFRAVQADA